MRTTYSPALVIPDHHLAPKRCIQFSGSDTGSVDSLSPADKAFVNRVPKDVLDFQHKGFSFEPLTNQLMVDREARGLEGETPTEEMVARYAQQRLKELTKQAPSSSLAITFDAVNSSNQPRPVTGGMNQTVPDNFYAFYNPTHPLESVPCAYVDSLHAEPTSLASQSSQFHGEAAQNLLDNLGSIFQTGIPVKPSVNDILAGVGNHPHLQDEHPKHFIPLTREFQKAYNEDFETAFQKQGIDVSGDLAELTEKNFPEVPPVSGSFLKPPIPPGTPASRTYGKTQVNPSGYSPSHPRDFQNKALASPVPSEFGELSPYVKEGESANTPDAYSHYVVNSNRSRSGSRPSVLGKRDRPGSVASSAKARSARSRLGSFLKELFTGKFDSHEHRAENNFVEGLTEKLDDDSGSSAHSYEIAYTQELLGKIKIDEHNKNFVLSGLKYIRSKSKKIKIDEGAWTRRGSLDSERQSTSSKLHATESADDRGKPPASSEDDSRRRSRSRSLSVNREKAPITSVDNHGKIMAPLSSSPRARSLSPASKAHEALQDKGEETNLPRFNKPAADEKEDFNRLYSLAINQVEQNPVALQGTSGQRGWKPFLLTRFNHLKR